MNKINIFNELLEKINFILQQHNIPFYLDCGTLLGCIRENKLIEYDTDVDITIHLLFWNKLKNIDFKKYNLTVTRILQNYPYKPNGNMISIKTTSSNYYCDIYANPAFPKLINGKLYNKIYPIPYNSELYLEQLYGKDWRIPSKNHADQVYHRNNGLVYSKYKHHWDNNYPIYECFF